MIGYSIDCLPHHRADVAIEILHEIGFTAIHVTLDANRLNPFDQYSDQQIDRIRRALGDGMRLVIDADAKYLTDREQRDEPSLASLDDRDWMQRNNLLQRAIFIAEAFENCSVVFSSGLCEPKEDESQVLDRLAARIETLSHAAENAGVPLAIRPRSGHVIASISNFERLLQWLASDRGLLVAPSLSTMASQAELPAVPILSRIVDRIACVLMPAGGSIDARTVHRDLRGSGFSGPCIFENSLQATSCEMEASRESQRSNLQGSELCNVQAARNAWNSLS